MKDNSGSFVISIEILAAYWMKYVYRIFTRYKLTFHFSYLFSQLVYHGIHCIKLSCFNARISFRVSILISNRLSRLGISKIIPSKKDTFLILAWISCFFIYSSPARWMYSMIVFMIRLKYDTIFSSMRNAF